MPKVTTPVLINPPDPVIDLIHPVETQLNNESNKTMYITIKSISYIYIYIYVNLLLLLLLLLLYLFCKSEIRWKFQM
jgi:hypothetical protein